MAKSKKAANDNTPNLFVRVRNWFEHSSAINALQKLDDRTLADIGLERSEIENFVRSWSERKDDVA